MRVDLALVERGLCESRTKAQALIAAGAVTADGKTVRKPSLDVLTDCVLSVRQEAMPFVSRGGLKLQGALDAFDLDVTDLVAVDLGASTGGFTDCLLRRGARRVYAIDAGRDQLHPSLRADPRVISREGLNARDLDVDAIGGEKADLMVCDLSFISQTKVYDSVCRLLKVGGHFISLIKPQFEAGPAYLNKHGIVRDERVHRRVKEQIRSAAREQGLICLGMADSPIAGGDGNREYLALFCLSEQTPKEETV